MIVKIAETEKQILIVTSQISAVAPMLSVIGTVLQQRPTQVQPFEAMRATDLKSFDLLIIDMHDGAVCLPLIRDLKKKLACVPIVAMVPYGDVDMVEQVLECGADDYISQPIPLQRLKTTLRNALRLRELLGASGNETEGYTSRGISSLFNAHGQLKPLREIEDDAIQHAIESCNGCITQAARALGVGRSTLYRKMQGRLERSSQISRENQTTRPTMAVSSIGDS